MLGYAYPALASAKAAVQEDETAFTQWMTYWVVISVFAVVETFLDLFVSWLPLYFEAKIVFILWLTLPRYQVSDSKETQSICGEGGVYTTASILTPNQEKRTYIIHLTYTTKSPKSRDMKN
ncbi:unnamed protein product [Choristocarpus tenellus]